MEVMCRAESEALAAIETGTLQVASQDAPPLRPATAAAVVQSLYPMFRAHVATEHRDELDLMRRLRAETDMRSPEAWYPLARSMKRRVIYHGGPTNSGKTYHALEALKAADPELGGGVFCGPLRLLALEVYESLNSQGVYCSLRTGQERRDVPFSTHMACTIEMVDVNRRYNVAVIDEIQMIGDVDRGHSWTRALLGIQADEIHICGSLESEDVVRRVLQDTGDELEVLPPPPPPPFRPEPCKFHTCHPYVPVHVYPIASHPVLILSIHPSYPILSDPIRSDPIRSDPILSRPIPLIPSYPTPPL